jgi:hypothetical protein
MFKKLLTLSSQFEKLPPHTEHITTKTMRTKTLLLVAAAAAAGVVASNAQVFSVNAVGYVNTPLVKGFNLISNPLNAQTNTVPALLAGQVPQDTTLFVWDATGKTFQTATYDTTFGWDGAAANATLTPGGGFFLKVNSGATVTFVGEVPQATPLHTPLIAGLQIVSSQVPQAGKLQTDLGYTPAQDDKVYQWSSSGQTYNISTFDTTFGWDPSEPTLGVGEAFFLSKTAAGSWDRNFSVNQ